VLEPLQDGLRTGGTVRADFVTANGMTVAEWLATGVAGDRRQFGREPRFGELPEHDCVGRRSVCDLEPIGDLLLRLSLIEDGHVDVDQYLGRDWLTIRDLERPQLAGGQSGTVMSGAEQREVGRVVDVTIAITVVPPRADLNGGILRT
jgi:hypothetical protein